MKINPVENSLKELSGKLVLVTGATGFTGSLLTNKLAAAGARVRALARPSSKIDSLASVNVEWIVGEIQNPEIISQAVDGVSYIFHVAACYREPSATDQAYINVHITSTELLAKEAIKNPYFKRFIHVSTVGVHGHIDNPPANEESPFAPGDIYQRTKAEAEIWLHRFANENHLPYTVIRPCAIYGPEDRRLFKLFRMAAAPVFPLLGNGRCLYHLIHVDDLTDAIILAATSENALSQTFIVGNPNAIALVDFAKSVCGALSRSCRVLRIPATPFFVLASICETICKPLGISPPIYKRRVAFYTKDRSFDTRKLRDLLGFEAKWTNEEGIRQTAKWYLDHGWMR